MPNIFTALPVAPREAASPPPKGWAEPVGRFEAARRNLGAQVEVYNPGAREEAARSLRWERHRQIERLTGQRLPMSAFMQQGEDVGSGGFAENSLDFAAQPEAIERQLGLRPTAALDDDAYEAAIDALREKQPDVMRAIPSRADLDRQLDQRLRRTAREAEEASRARPVSSFVGMAAGAMLDPVNLGATVFTGGLGAQRAIAQRALIQGGLNAGVEAAQQPLKVADARFGGPQPTAGQMALDVAAAGAGGAGIELVTGLAAKAVRRFSPPRETAAARAVELLDDADRLDIAIGERGGEDHQIALAALERGQVPRLEPARDLGDLFGDAPADGPARVDYRGRAIWGERYDPRALDVAPELFQYKADGDAQGVTTRLKGVEAWDPTSSGKVIVWETRDGRRMIADGHQRRGLALRLDAEGWETQLDGYTFREADGWSAPEVRVVAALKNIREGSGTILDAAKILRTAAKAMDDGSLPVTGEFIGAARGLSKLSDEAFGAVVNKVIPERYGADIGLMAGARPELHADMVALLKQMEPANGDEARAAIAEALQSDWIKTQGDTIDLFGYDPSVSAMIARAKIAASVKRALAKDARLFAQLVKNADAIEAGGNALARDANEAKLALDRAALEVTARLAMREGPIAEAMREAAARVTAGESVSTATKGVLARVRRAVEAGEALELSRGVAISPEAPAPAARALVDGFDDPAGEGARGQLVAKPEETGLEAAGAVTFKTAKGSTYKVGENGVTIRDKAARPEHPGANERGVQPASEVTFYISPQDADRMAIFQTQGGAKLKIIADGNGYYAVAYADGADNGKVLKDTIVKGSTTPAVGSLPVELWKDGTRAHFGNEIVEVSTTADAPPGLFDDLPVNDLYERAQKALTPCAPG